METLNSPNEAADEETRKAEKQAWLCLFAEDLMERVKVASTINRHE